MVATAYRDLRQTLQSDQEELINTRKRIAALEKAVEGSDLVLASYQRQFQAGRKTWQDLLNAVRELAQNQYALVDARAAMLGAMHRLQVRLGQDPQ
jgi:adhesin transport system outer membrane protein